MLESSVIQVDEQQINWLRRWWYCWGITGPLVQKRVCFAPIRYFLAINSRQIYLCYKFITATIMTWPYTPKWYEILLPIYPWAWVSMDQITLQTLSFYEYSPKDFHIEDHPLLNHNPNYLTHSLRRITHAAKVVVTVSLIVKHPSPQSVQKFGYAVTVGVVGHAVFGAGKVIVLVTTSTHAGRAGQEVSDGHKPAHHRSVLFRFLTVS